MAELMSVEDIKKTTAVGQENPISLFSKGVFVTIRKRGWSGRASNTMDTVGLSQDEADRLAIMNVGTRALIDHNWWFSTDLAEKWMKGMRKSAVATDIFARIESASRATLSRYGHRFGALDAQFVPWKSLPDLLERLKQMQADYNHAADLLVARYEKLKMDWIASHDGLMESMYPPRDQLRQRFSLDYSTFVVASPASLDENQLAASALRAEELTNMRHQLQNECKSFVNDYLRSFRGEVASFCQQVIEAHGEVSGHTLSAIRRKIDRFKEMNIFGDNSVVSQLDKLRSHLESLSGTDLKDVAVASRLSAACQEIRNAATDEKMLAALCGRVQRQIVLD